MPVLAGGSENPVVGQVDVGFQFRLVGVPDAPTHVRLPGAEPDLTDGHILDRDRVLALDRKRVTGSESGGVEKQLPLSVGTGGRRGGGAPRCRHGDILSRTGPAPDCVFHLLLQNHVITEKAWQADISRGGQAERKEEEECGSGGFHGYDCWGPWVLDEHVVSGS